MDSLVDRAALHRIDLAFSVQDALHPALEDHPIGSVDGHFLTVGNDFRGVAGFHESRHPEFPGNGCHVPRDAADVRHDGLYAAEERNVAGRGLPGDEYRAFGHVQKVVLGVENVGNASGLAAGSRRAGPEQDGVARDLAVHPVGVPVARAVLEREQVDIEGPRLYDHHPVADVHGPFDVLRLSEMLFQDEPVLGQGFGLMVGQAAHPLHLDGNRLVDQFAKRVHNELVLLANAPGTYQVPAPPVEFIKVRRNGTVHGIEPQPPHPVYEHHAPRRIVGIARVQDTAGQGFDHDQAQHAHYHVFVRIALAAPVVNRARVVRTREDLLVGIQQPVAIDAQDRGMLAREAGFRILARGARSHGDSNAGPQGIDQQVHLLEQ